MIRKLAFIAAILVPAMGNPEPLCVFVSVLPQKTFVEKIGAHLVLSAEKAARFKTERPIVELLGTCAQCTEKQHG